MSWIGVFCLSQFGAMDEQRDFAGKGKRCDKSLITITLGEHGCWGRWLRLWSTFEFYFTSPSRHGYNQSKTAVSILTGFCPLWNGRFLPHLFINSCLGTQWVLIKPFKVLHCRGPEICHGDDNLQTNLILFIGTIQNRTAGPEDDLLIMSPAWKMVVLAQFSFFITVFCMICGKSHKGCKCKKQEKNKMQALGYRSVTLQVTNSPMFSTVRNS